MASVRLGHPVFTKALNRISTLSSRYCECQHETEHWGEGSRAPKEAAAVSRISRGDFFFHATSPMATRVTLPSGHGSYLMYFYIRGGSVLPTDSPDRDHLWRAACHRMRQAVAGGSRRVSRGCLKNCLRKSPNPHPGCRCCSSRWSRPRGRGAARAVSVDMSAMNT